jgi:hypothetical protein
MKTKRGQSFPVCRQLTLGLIASAALTFSGCQDATGPGDFLPGLSIRTSAETIHFVPFGSANRITVPITVTNNSNKALDLVYCSELLERFSVNGWETVYFPFCTLQTLPPIPVGTSLTFNFHASDTPQQYSGFRFTDSPNVYRVSLGLWIVENGTSHPLPRAASVTNSFRVEP